MKFFNITNHQMSEAQEKDLKKNWGVTEVINLPEALKTLWGQVPADATKFELLTDIVFPIVKWIKQTAGCESGLIMVMGEFTASYNLIKYLNKDFTVVVATTVRESQEVVNPDGSVRKASVFKHIRFREL